MPAIALCSTCVGKHIAKLPLPVAQLSGVLLKRFFALEKGVLTRLLLPMQGMVGNNWWQETQYIVKAWSAGEGEGRVGSFESLMNEGLQATEERLRPLVNQRLHTRSVVCFQAFSIDATLLVHYLSATQPVTRQVT